MIGKKVSIRGVGKKKNFILYNFFKHKNFKLSIVVRMQMINVSEPQMDSI